MSAPESGCGRLDERARSQPAALPRGQDRSGGPPAGPLLVALQEERPAGIDPRVWEDPRRETDLYALWEALTALGQEVRLQGRALGRLREAVEAPREDPCLPLLRDLREHLEGQGDDPCLAVLLDLRERLARHSSSLRQALAEGAPWWLGLLPGERRRREVLESAAEGAELGQGRLEEALGRMGIAEVAALGLPFDPACMEAVDATPREGVAEGTVLEVYQAGYRRHGALLRPARVRVARAPERRPLNFFALGGLLRRAPYDNRQEEPR